MAKIEVEGLGVIYVPDTFKSLSKEEKQRYVNQIAKSGAQRERKKIKPKDEKVKVKIGFLLPQKKPTTYKTASKEAKKSSILNAKDFAKAKETIKFIKSKKWNSAELGRVRRLMGVVRRPRDCGWRGAAEQ